ncbi:MAG: hypothetical protein QM490_00500 [Candidatus Gracilibacteria bacterium]
MSEIPKHHDINEVEHSSLNTNNEALTPEQKEAFKKGEQKAYDANRLGNQEQAESGKEADLLIEELNNDNFNEGYPTKENMVQSLKEGNITNQTINDLNYVFPDNVLDRKAFATEIKASLNENNFAKLREVFDKKLQETHEFDTKRLESSSTGVIMTMNTEYTDLYKELFGITIEEGALKEYYK